MAAPLTPRGGRSPPRGDRLIDARSPGVWGIGLQVGSTTRSRGRRFNLVVREVRTVDGRKQVMASEVHRNLSIDTSQPALREGGGGSGVGADPRWSWGRAARRPGRPTTSRGRTATATEAVGGRAADQQYYRAFGDSLDDNGNTLAVSDGGRPDAAALKDGLDKLEAIAPNMFNILCLPAASRLSDAERDDVIAYASEFCRRKRAFSSSTSRRRNTDRLEINTGCATTATRFETTNAAVYFPRL